MKLDLRWFVMEALEAYIQEYELKSALDFYEQQLINKKGKILEIGQSHLFLLPELLNRGLQMEGLVDSKQGEEACKQKCEELNQTATIYQLSLNEFKKPTRYDAIIIPFGSVVTVEERLKSIKLLKNVYDHLKSKGTIIVDLFIQDEFLVQQKHSMVQEFMSDLYVCEKQLIKLDMLEQSTTYLLSVERIKEGKMIEKEQKLQPFIWYGIKEFKLILERIGFTNVNIYNNYSTTESTKSSDKKVFTFTGEK
ncbi:hypothetical protein [Metabacillus sp. B2-18]|uniref:hypothetical protein n=1 Tax=Metabacillus sp. B2-18 TaxID=2897333 RepID=UPI001E362956|nr:hypothetical protein [Metabacillus sp. B2-18]UGB31187.1 hypothetical protein LPC09_01120 [Metabacillus sp. B2-18]